MSQEPTPAVDGALFLERLEALWERSLVDLKAFAQRERCSFDEVGLPVVCSLCRVDRGCGMMLGFQTVLLMWDLGCGLGI